METVTIRKIKLDGTAHTWSAHLADEDERGRWMFTPKGSLVHHVQGDREWLSEMGETWAALAHGFLWLMPRDDWWYAAWWIRPDRQQIAIDACTVPTDVDGIWTWTDLELDICRNDRDGTVWVEDEDEFDESVAAGLIDGPAQRAARDVTARAEGWLTGRVKPFDNRGWELYADWTARGLPALPGP